MPHREVPVKVTAWVDEGVASLVLALNELAGVITLDSCQETEDGYASVFFAFRGAPHAAAAFVTDLAMALAPREAVADYVLTAEWRPGLAEPVFRLVCPAAHAEGLAAVLSVVAESSDGRFGIALRS